jgi:hypothetical protein
MCLLTRKMLVTQIMHYVSTVIPELHYVIIGVGHAAAATHLIFDAVRQIFELPAKQTATKSVE